MTSLMTAQKMTAEQLGSGGLPERLEGDLVAEAFELADGAAAGVVGVALGHDRGSLFAVVSPVLSMIQVASRISWAIAMIALRSPRRLARRR